MRILDDADLKPGKARDGIGSIAELSRDGIQEFVFVNRQTSKGDARLWLTYQLRFVN